MHTHTHTHTHPHTHTLCSFQEGEKVVLITFSLVGFLFFAMVYVAAVLNHAVQSELLVWLISSVNTLLVKNEYPNIDAAIKVYIYTVRILYMYTYIVKYESKKMSTLLPHPTFPLYTYMYTGIHVCIYIVSAHTIHTYSMSQKKCQHFYPTLYLYTCI